MTTRRMLLVCAIVIAMLGVAFPAYAYVSEVPASELARISSLRFYFADPENPSPEEIATIPCVACHGARETGSPDIGDEPYGPHGGYITTSNKCWTCHSVHQAEAGGIVLLPAATVLATCETCHDGTGGTGVYGVVKARTGEDPPAQHRMIDSEVDPVTTIPGGDYASGGSQEATFAGTAGGLTCTDCHSVHGAYTVAAFTGDRARSAESTSGAEGRQVVSNRLLRQRPTSMDASSDPVLEYGSDWCGACHAGRLSGTSVHNHPVDSGAGAFVYEGVAYPDETTGTLGYNNNGYVMPDPRTPLQQGHGPICQQCHEDARHVGDVTSRTVDPSEAFKVTSPDGGAESDNPRFQVFPHESDKPSFLIETDDDLCLNCHKRP